MGPLLAAAIPALGSVVGGALGYFGQRDANAANAKQAQLNRDFQERMSNTSVQRHKADLIAAGFNPALAVGQQASSPAGNTAHIENAAGSGANSAANAAQAIATVRATMAQQQKTEAETERVELETSKRRFDIPYENAMLINDSNVRAALAQLHADPGYVALLRKQMEQDLRYSTAKASGEEFTLPGMRNAANAANTWWGRNISPYLNDASKAAGIAMDVALPVGLGRVGRVLRTGKTVGPTPRATSARGVQQADHQWVYNPTIGEWVSKKTGKPFREHF